MRFFQLSVFVVSSVFIMYGCTKPAVTQQELKEYIFNESNGLYKKIDDGAIVVELSYKPHDLVLIQEIDGHEYAPISIDSIQNKLWKFDYFTLGLSYEGKELVNNYASDPIMFNKVITHLSFEIGKSIKIIHQTDTIPIYDYMYFRGYGVTPMSEVLLVFNSALITKEGKFQVLYNDEFFKTGLNTFEFEIDDIRSIPTLNRK